jgi:hypothetical protein
LKILKNLKDKGIMPYPCTLEHCKDSLFARLWYSNVQSIFDLWQGVNKKDEIRKKELCEKYKNAKFGIMNFDEEHYACSGSWYLGILKQSLRPRLGYHLIDEIVSMDKNLLRYQLGAGFPVRKPFYKFYGKENVVSIEGLTFNEIRDSIEGGKKCHRKLCRRESICGNDVELYREIRPIIANKIFEILEKKKKVKPKELKEVVDKIINEINKKQEELTGRKRHTENSIKL